MYVTIKNIASNLNIKTEQIQSVLEMIGDGATVPFIARYRKAVTGGLDEEQIEKINDYYVYGTKLEKRRESIIN